MFGKLPDFFNKNFAIGYFLPFAIFLAANYLIFQQYGILTNIIDIANKSQFEILAGTTIIGLVSWIGGTVLLVANRDIIRLLEGYGKWNPLQLLLPMEKKRFRRLQEQFAELDLQYTKYESENREFPDHLKKKRDQLMRDNVEKYPDDESYLLPTSFGNIIRAFETYPTVMYGADSIPSWNRLFAVLPQVFQDMLNDAKAGVDFWVNIGFLSLFLLVEYIGFIINTQGIKAPWFVLAVIILSLISYTRAKSSAIEWGDIVKACFDVYLPELGKKLWFSLPENLEEQQKHWRSFSQAVIYRDPDYMPARVDPESRGSSKK